MQITNRNARILKRIIRVSHHDEGLEMIKSGTRVAKLLEWKRQVNAQSIDSSDHLTNGISIKVKVQFIGILPNVKLMLTVIFLCIYGT